MSDRLYRPLALAVVDVLEQIMKEHEHAASVIGRKISENKKWGSRDRSFIVETTQDILRHFRKLAWSIGKEYTDPKLNMWHVVGAWWLMKGNELPPYEPFDAMDALAVSARLGELTAPAIKLSMPDELMQLATDALQQKAETELEAMLQEADLYIRVNIFKTNRDTLQKQLKKQDIETARVDGAPDALRLVKRRHLMNLPQFKNGLFEVQDAGSQLIAPYLDVQAGMRVVDACAGGGGKTMHLADLMKNTGQIVAMDVAEIKLRNIRTRADRTGFSNIRASLVTDARVEELYQWADRLLLDVPCSGLGVLKRNPDTKWRLTTEEIMDIISTQQQILEKYHTMLKPGGKMVYATCSILPQENELQVERFIAKYPEYSLVQQQYAWPSELGGDGFYMALLQKGVK